jgi:hypothetical protein
VNLRLPRLSDEQGAAVVIALATITITAAIAGALITGGISFLHSSSADGANKRALEAAQAGLNVGAYRLGKIGLSPTASFTDNCVTDREVVWSSSTPHCPATTGYFNNGGASSSYYLTPVMSGSALSGMSTVATQCGPAAAGERCLTATGTVNGVTRRLQERVKTTYLFNLHGIAGLKGVDINSSNSWSGPNFQITSDTASNGPITFGQNVSAPGSPYGCIVGPAGSAPGGCPLTRYPQAITVSSVDTLPFNTTQTTNSDATITLAQGYTAATRSLVVPANATLTLAAGDYNFCYVTVGNGAKLSAASGARVRIFVDSPARAGSGCTGPTGGKFNAASTSAQLNPGAATTPPAQLEIYVYGTATPPANLASPPPATCNADFTFVSSAATASSNLYVYAPDSNVSIQSNAYQMGAVVGCQVTYFALSASARWDYPPGGTAPSAGAGPVTGTFRECAPQFSGNPESGCG